MSSTGLRGKPILVDTHILLWALTDSPKLTSRARDLIQSADAVLFSAASIWEIAIKAQLGRVDFAVAPRAIAEAALLAGFRELPVDSVFAAMVAELPVYHRDPFDRLLIAQALALTTRMLTADATLTQYSELILLS
jgi:PIN domain nuclease of toxin-antitoxin system